jgi:hypothetical protein
MMLRKLILLVLMSATCIPAAVVSGSEPDAIPVGTKLGIRLKLSQAAHGACIKCNVRATRGCLR